MKSEWRPRSLDSLIRSRGAHRARQGYRKVHQGAWVPDIDEPALNDGAAALEALTFVCPGVVATGWLAADFHGHPWPPKNIPLEVATSARQIRRPGVTAHRYEVPRSQVSEYLGPGKTLITVASPAWAMFDLARQLPPDDAVVALDGTRWMPCNPQVELPQIMQAHPEFKGKQRVQRALGRMDRRSESPWETRTRLFLVDRGFDCFVSQYTVRELRYRLDLAAPEYLVAVEYDGEHHRSRNQHASDLIRWDRLRSAGWHVISVTKTMLTENSDELATSVDRALRTRGWPGPR